MDYQQMVKDTHFVLDDLSVGKGDIFNEMLSVWFYVVDEKKNKVHVIRRWGGDKFEDEGWMTKRELRTRLSYSTKSEYWVVWSGNDKKKCESLLTYLNDYTSKSLGIT